jgi:gluconolactonase
MTFNPHSLILFAPIMALILGCHPSSEKKEEGDARASKALQLTIERDHEIMDLLFPKGTGIEILGEGFEWTEGPLWLEERGKLLFSDIPNNEVLQWTEKEGVSSYLKPAGYTGDTPRGGESGSNGLLLSPEGDLVLCQHGDRRMAKMQAPLDQPRSNFETIVGEYKGKRFNSPNDAVYDLSGNLYFTDPAYGLEERMEDPKKELDFQGVYRFDPNEEELILLLDSISRPNGIAFLPGENALIIANSDPEKPVWYIYQVLEQGKSLGNGQIFYDASETFQTEQGLPDGLKVTQNGIVIATGPGGIWVFDAHGVKLGRLKVGDLVSNVALDESGGYVYATANSRVIRIPLKLPTEG